MALKRATVRSSTRQRVIKGTPLATYFDPNMNASAPPGSNTEPYQDKIARQAAQHAADQQYSLNRWMIAQSASLQQKRDADALDRLKAGDYDYFMSYSEERAGSSSDPAEQSYWANLHDKAMAAAQDATISGLIASGDMDLSELRTILLERRDNAPLGDPQFIAISKQIAEVNKAIQAEAFNKVIGKAFSAYSETGDPKPYLDTLVQLLPLARDDQARKDLYTQIKTLRSEVEKDAAMKDQQEVAVKVIAYNADAGNATDLLILLAQKARNAKDPTEANRYVTLAQQVVAHERQRQQDAISGSGGTGGSSTAFKKAVDAALQPGRNAYDDAVDHIQKIIRNGDVPGPDDWAVFWAAGDRVREGAQFAISKGASGTLMDSLLKEVRTVDEQRDIQRKAAGAQVIQQANDQLTAMKDRTSGIKNLDQLVTAVEPTREQLRKMSDSGYLTNAQRADMNQKIISAEKPVRDQFDAAVAAMKDPTLTKSYKDARSDFDKYLQAYEQVHGTLNGAADFDRWRNIIGNPDSTIEGKGTELGVFTPGTSSWASTTPGKWGTASYNADNITKATAIKRSAEEEASTYLTQIEQGGKLLRPGWIPEEIIEGRPTEAGRMARMGDFLNRQARGDNTRPGQIQLPPGAQLPLTSTEPDWGMAPPLNEMRLAQAANRRAALYPEDAIMQHLSPDAIARDKPSLIGPGITPDFSVAPTAGSPEAGLQTPPQPTFDLGAVTAHAAQERADMAAPSPIPPQGYSVAPVEGSPEASFAQFQTPPSYVSSQPVNDSWWLDAFNHLSAGYNVDFPVFTIPELDQRPSFEMPSFNLAPIPTFDYTSVVSHAAQERADMAVPPAPVASGGGSGGRRY